MTDNPSDASDKACYQTRPEAEKPAPELAFLLNAWLHGRPQTTVRCYRRDAEGFFAHLRKSARRLEDAQLDDLQTWVSTLTGAQRSIARHVAAVRSLLGFAHKLGYLKQDPSQHLRVRKPVAAAPRILTEAEVQRMIGAEPDHRARVALRLLYATGIRNSELCALRHHNVVTRRKAIEATVLGKGDKPRVVEIPPAVWREVLELSPARKPADPLIPGRSGAPIGSRALHRLVKRAARRCGLTASPHWLRHAHGSHALDHGAPVHLVRDQLGHASLATTSGYLHARGGDSASKYLPGME